APAHSNGRFGRPTHEVSWRSRRQALQSTSDTKRGTADRYSDLELDVYWSAPPSDAERRAAVERAGGTLLELFPYEDDEWAEEITVGGFHVGTSTFLVQTMERYLAEVVDEYSTRHRPQIQLSSVLHAHARGRGPGRAVAGEGRRLPRRAGARHAAREPRLRRLRLRRGHARRPQRPAPAVRHLLRRPAPD